MPPRDGLRGRYEGFSAVSAIHPVVPNEELVNFTDAAEIMANYLFDPFGSGDTRSLDEKTKDGDVFKSNRYYGLRNPQDLALSVVEAAVPVRAAKKARAVWEGQDLAALRGHVEDEAARRSPDSPLTLVCDRIVSVGGRLHHGKSLRGQVALAPNPEDPETAKALEIIYAEHEMVLNAILDRIRRGKEAARSCFARYDFMPHVTFMSYRGKTDLGHAVEVNAAIGEFLRDEPLTIQLSPLTTTNSRLVR
jgi:hypothetical protein